LLCVPYGATIRSAMASNYTFLTDGNVNSAIVDVINTARREVLLVSPYVDLWGQAVDALRTQAKRGLPLVAFVRDPERPSHFEGIKSLVECGVSVWCVPGLHAKVYSNETLTVVGSINLTAGSLVNSHEIAFVVRDEEMRKQIATYVNDTLRPLAQRFRANELPSTPVKAKSKASPISGAAGHCIRCDRRVPLNLEHPLCEGCYEVWAEYGEETYQEKYCHSCGKREQTSYARPVCSTCYRPAARR